MSQVAELANVKYILLLQSHLTLVRWQLPFVPVLLASIPSYHITSLVQKNQPGKIIIVYDEDERVAPKAATTLVERGYDNLFLLSGGEKIYFFILDM